MAVLSQGMQVQVNRGRRWVSGTVALPVGDDCYAVTLDSGEYLDAVNRIDIKRVRRTPTKARAVSVGEWVWVWVGARGLRANAGCTAARV